MAKDFGLTTDAGPISLSQPRETTVTVIETVIATMLVIRTPSPASLIMAAEIIVEAMTIAKCGSINRSVVHPALAASRGEWMAEACGSTTAAAQSSVYVPIRMETDTATMAMTMAETRIPSGASPTTADGIIAGTMTTTVCALTGRSATPLA